MSYISFLMLAKGRRIPLIFLGLIFLYFLLNEKCRIQVKTEQMEMDNLPPDHHHCPLLTNWSNS